MVKISEHNVSIVKYNQLCTGCGICEDICPRHCITISRINGEHRPTIEDNLCLGAKCGRCLKICPGIGVDLVGIANEKFNDFKVYEDKYIGRYVGLHTGYSLDDDIRLHSASGGMVSLFLIYLLEKGIIDGAVVTGYQEDNITPYSYIAKSREDIINARSSKYCPVALNKIGNEIIKEKGNRYVIVGLPCHIEGFRKRTMIDRKFREKIVGLFAIYCSSERTFNAQDYLLKHYKVEKSAISYFSYRDNGCLGNLTIKTNNNTNISVPYISFYGPILRSFFKPHRCLTCIDHYGELADVCFGDIHIAPYDQDKIGISSWITRTEYWEEQFRSAAKEGYIKMDDLDAKILNESQSVMLYPKRKRAGAVANMDKLLGRRVPVFDKPFEEPTIKDYFAEIICHCQRFVGRHKSLWFIIEFLNKITTVSIK